MAAGRGAGGRFATGNIFGQGALGFAVGNIEFLTGQEAKAGKYFRSIEFGTHGFAGKKLSGLWGPGTRLEPAGPLFQFGEGTGQQFFPFGSSTGDERLDSPAAALRYMREHGFGENERPRMRGIVRHEIAPLDAYTKAWERFDPVAREMLAIEQAFRDSGLGMASQASGVKPRGRSNSSGSVGKSFESRLSGHGFIRARAISTRSRSLANIDRTFRANLTEANRLLAQAFAAEVALAIQENLKRKLTSKGWMEEDALNAANRFPA